MLSVDGKIEVRCSLEEAWALFCRFGDVAALIPTVEEVEVDGERVHARLSTKIGALPISSRVTLEVIERKQFECLRAEGFSYLGETIKEQLKKDVAGVAHDSVGRMHLHLDLRPSERAGHIHIIYNAEVEAKGRLKRIYQTILKTKVPGMMAEFAVNLRGALEREEVLPVAPAETATEPSEVVVAAAPGTASRPPASITVRPSLWARIVAWLHRVLAFARDAA